ncbi:hypothetical protein [Bradyrhizobium sp. USDA 4353]
MVGIGLIQQFATDRIQSATAERSRRQSVDVSATDMENTSRQSDAAKDRYNSQGRVKLDQHDVVIDVGDFDGDVFRIKRTRIA